MMGRCAQQAFNRPMHAPAMTQGPNIQSERLSPISQGFRLALPCDVMHGAAVAHLFKMGAPAHVAGLIISIVVDAVQRRAVGSLAYIAQKGRKILAPGLAHLNSTAAIVRISIVRRQIAAIFGCLPRSVCRRFAARRMTMTKCSGPDTVRSQAPATLHHAGPQGITWGLMSLAAIALTQPSRFTVPGQTNRGRSDQPAESLPLQIDLCRPAHGANYIRQFDGVSNK